MQLIQNQAGVQGSLCGVYTVERTSTPSNGFEAGGGGQSGTRVLADVPCNGMPVRPRDFIVTGGTRWNPTGYFGPDKCPSGWTYKDIASSYGEQVNLDTRSVTTVTTNSASCLKL